MHDAFTGLVVAALRQVILEHRCRRFLDLEEQRVLLVASLEQDDVGAGADAADADDLACDVDEPKPLEQVAAIVLQRLAVGAELFVEPFLDLVGGDPEALGDVGQAGRRSAAD